jgi:hypothetical protein
MDRLQSIDARLTRSREAQRTGEKPSIRATISLDIIFVLQRDGSKKPYIVEINGEQSGIKGYVQATRHTKGEKRLRHILGEIRARDNEAFWSIERQLCAFGEKIDLLIKDNSISKEGIKRAQQIIWPHSQEMRNMKMMTHSNKNDWDVETLAMSKNLQPEVLRELSPRTYVSGDSAVSSTGYWIIKPRGGVAGRNITIARNSSFQSILEDYDLNEAGFVAQEFHHAWKADFDTRPGNYPASLRVLIDFDYFARFDTVEPHAIFVYQRSAPEPVSPEDMYSVHGSGKHVVNLSRGAIALEASEEEKNVATELATIIAGRLSRHVLRDREDMEQLKRAQEFSFESEEEEKLFGTTAT